MQQKVRDGRRRFTEQRQQDAQRQQVAQVVGPQGEHLGQGTKDRKSKKKATKQIQNSTIREAANTVLDQLDLQEAKGAKGKDKKRDRKSDLKKPKLPSSMISIVMRKSAGEQIQEVKSQDDASTGEQASDIENHQSNKQSQASGSGSKQNAEEKEVSE